jgi:hypothetical protein
VRAADATQQLLVDFANEANRERQLLEALQAMVHGAHVVRDLIDVAGCVWRNRVGFCRQEILKRALRPFDLLDSTASLRTYM